MPDQQLAADRELQALLVSLLETLQAEYSAAQQRETEQLSILTQKKTSLIESLGKLSGENPQNKRSDTVLGLLKQCRQQNEDNGQILQVGLRNAQRLHNILQGEDGLPTTYDGGGEPDFPAHSGAPLAKI